MTIPALTGVSGLSLASTLPWAGNRPSLIVSDARFQSCRQFGAAAAQAGLQHFSFDGDITSLWFEHLDPKWLKHQSVVAGMTARQPLFVLERLAWDRGMRVVLRVEHNWLDDGSIAHRIEAPGHQLPPLANLLEGQADWSDRLARMSANCSWRNQGACSRGTANSPALHQPGRSASLVSWVIAPARPA